MWPRFRWAIVAFALLVSGLILQAATPGVTAGSAAIVPLGGVWIDIVFSPMEQAVAGIQFDIRYQPEALGLTASAGLTISGNGKTLYTSNPQPDILRVLVTGLNQTPIESGVLATLSVQVKAGTMPGVYPLTIENVVASDGADGAVDLPASNGSVTVTETTAGGPVIAAVGNAANYEAGAVAPGEVIVIYGSSLGGAAMVPLQINGGSVATVLAGTRVLFEGVPAPLLYVSGNQVSAIAPYGLDGHAQTSLQVEYLGLQSPPFLMPVTKAAPGIFTTDSSGIGQGAILNQDGSINTPDHPAAPGSVISIYGTGDGQTLPGGQDGIIIGGASDLRYTLLPVSASIGGVTAEVVYAGSVGGEVAGIFQVNVRIPKELSSAGSFPLTLAVGDIGAQTGVTVAVQ